MIIARYIISLCIIFACLFIGNQIQSLLHITLPGSVIGMILLISLLATGILPAHWVKPSASLFLKYMMFLFVPISVGLMDHFDTLFANALPILVSSIGGTAIVIVVLSLFLQRRLKGDEE